MDADGRSFKMYICNEANIMYTNQNEWIIEKNKKYKTFLKILKKENLFWSE